MFRISLSKALGLAIAIIVLSAVVPAQSGQVEGTVKMNAEGGAKKLVPGALVDIYRTDIKGHWSIKTDKNGHYVLLGLPLQGTFLFIASGPGIQPTWVSNVRITQSPVMDIVAESGDGSTMTLEQVQQAMAQQKAGGGGQPAPKAISAADKSKMEASQKEQDSKRKEAEAVQGSFDQARTHYNSGVELMNAKNYENALSEFEQASTVDASKHAAMKMLAYKAGASLAEAHYQLGVDQFNKKQRPEAKIHFEAAVASVKKAIAAASTDTAENNPSVNADLVIYYNILAKNVSLLVQYYGAADLIDDTVKQLEKAQALDAPNANKWEVAKADMFRSAGRTDEAVAVYKKVLAADPSNADALYGLGLTLIASSERAQIQEGANVLAEFLAKAPATDRRVPDVKSSLEELKNGLKIEAEKPAAPSKRKRP